jgi:hypothetical protein
VTIVLDDSKPKQLLLDSGDSFYIENHNPEKSLEFGWAGRTYHIGPMKKRLVPFDVVALYYGDPRSRVGQILSFQDSTGSGQVPERHSEVKRLCIRYGVYEQGAGNIIESLAQRQQEERMAGRTPLRDENLQVRITTDTGEEIVPPLFDHEGTLSRYEFTHGTTRSDDVATIIDNLTTRINQLEDQKNALDDLGGENDDDGIEFDNPGPMP